MVGWEFSNKFRSQWIKVKFYNEKPEMGDAETPKGVRFCEATKKAILHPVLLDKKSISCPGAQYTFGWKPRHRNKLLQNCYDKRQIQRNTLKSMLSRMPYFKKPFKYIGLNTEGTPDLVMSYMPPEEIMGLIKMHHNRKGGKLDVSLYAMMSICGGIAVRTYLDRKISISFGCDDSRRYAGIKRENLAVGIPKKLFNTFLR